MKIAIIGATGLVGRTILEILWEKGYLENNEIILYASAKSSGMIVCVHNHSYIVRKLCDESIDNDISFALFSAGTKVSIEWAKKFTKNGTYVIDNSSAFRRQRNIPLVVPEINIHTISPKTRIISNPNCSTILLSLPLFALHRKFYAKRIVVSTYQAVSGAGMKGLQDLKNNTTEKFTHPIQNNLIPQIDRFLTDGNTFEEDKLSYEIKKIFEDKNIKLSATAVRVPIENCHSESVNIEFEKSVNLNQAKYELSKMNGLTLLNENYLPTPKIANQKNDVFVGRVRIDKTQKNTLNLFLCGDNIRKGAALNAIEIMENIIKNHYNLQN